MRDDVKVIIGHWQRGEFVLMEITTHSRFANTAQKMRNPRILAVVCLLGLLSAGFLGSWHHRLEVLPMMISIWGLSGVLARQVSHVHQNG